MSLLTELGICRRLKLQRCRAAGAPLAASIDRRYHQNEIMKSNQTKPIGHSMFGVQCWLLNVAVLAIASSALAGVHYVDVNGTNATPPYTSWATAATNIQDAVDIAVAGDEVVVTNGSYGDVFDPLTVDRTLNIRSVNGPEFTAYGGGVFLTNGTSLFGFTLSDGDAGYGGGGGASGGTLNNCIITGNSAYYGGGAAYCTLNNCTLTGNSAHRSGGGAYVCTLNNCTLTGNSASDGGGTANCTLNNCTLTGNSALATAQGTRGGATGCIENNCIQFGNLHRVLNSGLGGDYKYICEDCDSPGRLAGNNWVGDPLFSFGLHLRSNSPCINAGNNSYVKTSTDLDGNPRLSGGTVDIGAYEYQWPHLTITSSDTNVVLTWPTNNLGYDHTGFTVQSTTDLIPPLVWTTNSPAPVVINGQNTVTNPITGDQMFFRLSQ
jgi:parallel beta-helix repeat protein